MRIGIITPAFNVAPFIGATIQSVLDQTHQDWTLLVVDDGSTDQTASQVMAFRDPRIDLISQPNAGVSAARNRGLAMMECDAVLFLDGDDELAPFALSALSRALTDFPAAIAAVGAYQRGTRVYHPPSGDLLAQLMVRNVFANGGHVLIRRNAAQPFRQDLVYGEDWECWVRLALQRAPPCYAAFAPTRTSDPVLHVRERYDGAFQSMAARLESFLPCLNAIYGNPDLANHFDPTRLAELRCRAEAEAHWVVGREMIRHRDTHQGLMWLRRSVLAVPTRRRAALFAAAAVLTLLPPAWRGPLRPYTSGRNG